MPVLSRSLALIAVASAPLAAQPGKGPALFLKASNSGPTTIAVDGVSITSEDDWRKLAPTGGPSGLSTERRLHKPVIQKSPLTSIDAGVPLSAAWSDVSGRLEFAIKLVGDGGATCVTRVNVITNCCKVTRVEVPLGDVSQYFDSRGLPKGDRCYGK
jgi:hypothetical protein